MRTWLTEENNAEIPASSADSAEGWARHFWALILRLRTRRFPLKAQFAFNGGVHGYTSYSGRPLLLRGIASVDLL